jgi:hypothetical protein
MTSQNQNNYRFSHRYKGELNLSLFDKYYLQVEEKKLKKTREFKMEVATLDPEPIHIKGGTTHWLVAALILGLVDAYLIYDAMTSTANNGAGPFDMLLLISTATLLTALFTGLYLFSMQHKWVLETRASRYPLIEIPYLRKDKVAAKEFVEQLRVAILRNLQDKEYTTDALFAGEMRMLRRLAKKHILSDKSYSKAKQQMLASH